MNWIKDILLGDSGESASIAENKKQVEMQSKAHRRHGMELVGLDLEIAKLKQRTERMHLAITALTQFLLAKGLMQKEELEIFLEEVDILDGEADGKLAFPEEQIRPRLVIPKKKK